MTDKLQQIGHQRGFRWWVRRILIVGLSLILVLGVATLLAGSVARRNLINKYPAPGRLIDVGGYKMHIDCKGEGNPTVILEAGLNDFSIFWSLVQPEVAKFNRVCVYDRAGYGWSDSSPSQRSGVIMVAELQTLLVNAGEKGPYLLVGHSFGGILMRIFAHRYPDEVVGIVLVDAAHEDLFNRIPEWRQGTEYMLNLFRTLTPLRTVGVLALMPGSIPNRGLPEEALAQYRAVLATTNYLETSVVESSGFEANLAQARSSHIASLGDLPLIVISNGLWKPMSELPGISGDETQRAWQGMQAELVTLSSNSQQIVAEQSEHFIHLQQPQLVVGAIRELLSAIALK